jgi:hypothetical protein
VIQSPNLKPSVASDAAATKKLLLEGPIVATMLRLAVPNVMNLLAFVGVIIFNGYFLGQISTSALAGGAIRRVCVAGWASGLSVDGRTR